MVVEKNNGGVKGRAAHDCTLFVEKRDERMHSFALACARSLLPSQPVCSLFACVLCA